MPDSNATAGVLYLLKISFKPDIRGRVLTDPFTAAPLMKKLESVPAAISLAGRGAWGPGPVYNLESWDWTYQVILFGDDTASIFNEQLRSLPEVLKVDLQPANASTRVLSATKEAAANMGQIEASWMEDKAITEVWGVSQPTREVIPKGFRLW